MKQLKNILVIDDDRILQLICKQIIKNYDPQIKVDGFLNAEEALNHLGHLAEHLNGHIVPDLILLDLNMPKIDGWEFLEQARKIKFKEKENIVIAILSSSVFPEDKMKASQYGEIAEYIEKPLTKTHLDRIRMKYFA